jgi:hypothetical protein
MAMAAALAYFSSNPGLILACGLVVAIAVGLLWRRGEPPVLLMAAGLQLCQVVIRPFYADLTGVPLESISILRIGDVAPAIWFALAAILSLVVGMWRGQSGAPNSYSLLQLEARAWSPRAAFFFFLLTLLLSVAFDELGSITSGLGQPAQAAAAIEWVGVFAVAFVCITQRRGYTYLALVVLFEVAKGFGGFFSDFKTVFFVTFIALIATSPKLKPRLVLAGALLSALLLTLGAVWTVIKGDYRSYITQGMPQGYVSVPLEDRLAYLATLIGGVDEDTVGRGFDSLVQRVQYVDLLAATMGNVPASVPFENGALIGGTILHILQPRLLFPDKPPLPSDTEIAVRYSGLALNAGGNAEGTSISLGYIAELYVDLGIIGTLAATLIMGFGFGRSVKYLTSHTALPAIVNFGFALTLMLSVSSFEESLVKMIGAFVTTFAVILVIRKSLSHLLNQYGPKRLLLGGAHSLKPI